MPTKYVVFYFVILFKNSAGIFIYEKFVRLFLKVFYSYNEVMQNCANKIMEQ